MGHTTDYRNWLKTKLEEVAGLNIYTYATIDNIEYPYIQIINDGSEGKVADNVRMQRTYKFKMELIMSVSDVHFGKNAGMEIFWDKADEIIAIFDKKDARHTGITSDIVSFSTAGDPEYQAVSGALVLKGSFLVSIVRLNE